MPVSKPTPYENVEQGIQRVHRANCSRKRCACPYRAEVYDRVTKKRVTKSCPSLASARRWRADKQTALLGGSFRVTAKVTVREVWEEWDARAFAGTERTRKGAEYKPATLSNYRANMRDHLLPRFGHVPLNDLRLNHVQDYVDQKVSEGYAGATVRAFLVPLTVVFNYAIHRQMVTVSPCAHLRLPAIAEGRTRIETPAEALKLIAAIPDVQDRALWATACFSGLRRGELLDLRWENVDLAGQTLRVQSAWCSTSRQTVKPKTKAGTRTVPFPRLLAGYLAQLDGTEGRVFTRGAGLPLSEAGVRRRALKAWTVAGLNPIGLHECRHTYASYMIAAGVNIKTLSEAMGHSGISITLDRYGHLMPGAGSEAMVLLDAYLAKELS